ncbi:MAG: N-acetyltransferase [Bacillota bacterium]
MIYKKAAMEDVPQCHDLIQHYASQGLMLRRPLMMLYEGVRDMVVAVDGTRVVGTGCLHVLWHDLAEVRSLAVEPAMSRRGIGRNLVEFMLREAQEIGIARVFTLTYQQDFFDKCGFTVASKEQMPQKVWKECVYCDKFHRCDETAMIRLVFPNGRNASEIPLVERPKWK